jgi:hypothetical protein
VWDGESLMPTFKRNASNNDELMNVWFELVGIAESVELCDDRD